MPDNWTGWLEYQAFFILNPLQHSLCLVRRYEAYTSEMDLHDDLSWLLFLHHAPSSCNVFLFYFVIRLYFGFGPVTTVLSLNSYCASACLCDVSFIVIVYFLGLCFRFLVLLCWGRYMCLFDLHSGYSCDHLVCLLFDLCQWFLDSLQ